MSNNSRLSLVFSVISANIIPVIGVIFFDWHIFTLFLNLLLEMVMVGIYSVIRVLQSHRELTLQDEKGFNFNILSVVVPKDSKPGLLTAFIFNYAWQMFIVFSVVWILHSAYPKPIIITQVLVLLVGLAVRYGIQYVNEAQQIKKNSAYNQAAFSYNYAVQIMLISLLALCLIFFVQNPKLIVVLVFLVKSIWDWAIVQTKEGQ